MEWGVKAWVWKNKKHDTRIRVILKNRAKKSRPGSSEGGGERAALLKVLSKVATLSSFNLRRKKKLNKERGTKGEFEKRCLRRGKKCQHRSEAARSSQRKTRSNRKKKEGRKETG